MPNEKIFPLSDGIGYVLMVDHMGDDQRVADSARVSYGKGTSTKRNLEGLINYLMANGHSSPFEQVIFTFEVRVPLMVARQWLRHRTLSANELSARYSEVEDEFYIPAKWREQDTVNKQGSWEIEGDEDMQADLSRLTEKTCRDLHGGYKLMLEAGIAREMARMMLPQNIYTSFVFTQNLHNLLHFLRLRLHPHAQYEIRVYAEAILQLITPVVPLAVAAWREHQLEAVKFSKSEMELLRTLDRQTLPAAAKDSGMKQSRIDEFLGKLG